MRIFLFCILCCTGIWLFYSSYFNNTKTEIESKNSSVADALSGEDNENFLRAENLREFSFPDDHGPHPDYQTEWWYYTGNLQTTEGRHFGFQFTIFRRALSPNLSEKISSWASNQIYFAHFTISDIENQKFFCDEKFSRGAMGLAGAQKQPLKIWIENWSIQKQDNKYTIAAATPTHQIHLEMNSLKPIVLNGNKGFSQKSKTKGNASYYYSETRLQTSGTIQLADKKYNVNGLSWLDREWSTSVLDKNQSGWDWFSLQFEDGREIMLYQLRLKDGTIDTSSSGTYIAKDGSSEFLTAQDFSIQILDHWLSPESNTKYPSKWKLTIPKYHLEFVVTPLQNNQELLLNFTYWEGAVQFEGKNVQGNGYVELTGYKNAIE